MSNTFAPFGLSQTGGNPGVSPSFEQSAYSILYSDTNKIFSGDPVKMTAGGYVAAWTAGTAVSQLFGIFNGCEYLSTSQGRVVWSPYWPGSDVASTAQSSIVAYVIPCAPGSAPRFVAQTGNSNTTATAVTIADIGQNIDVAMGTGNAANGRSGAYLDQYTQGVAATLPFRIISLYPGVGNGSDATSANNWVIVEANTLQTTGI
jgi:hypothetical protein